MLTVLRIVESRPTARRWFRRRVTLPPVWSRTVPVPDGAYRVTTAVRAGAEPDWAALRREVGCESGRLLLPRGLTPPSGSGIAAFSGSLYARTMMQKALVQALRASGLPPTARSVGIYDPAGALHRLPLEMLREAGEVRVVTRRPDRYAETAAEAMATQGASFLVLPEWRALGGCGWIAAPDGLDGLPLHGEWGTFSAAEQRRSGVADGYLPAGIEKWLAALPTETEPLRFLAGLFECSRILSIASGAVTKVRENGGLRPFG